MKTVIRDKNTSEISHVHYMTVKGIHYFVSKRDFETLNLSPSISEIDYYFGDDDKSTLKDFIRDILRENLSVEELKYEIFQSNGVLKDDVIKEKL